jgi:hypothetical protein
MSLFARAASAARLPARVTVRRVGRQLWRALRARGTLGAGLHGGQYAAILGRRGRRAPLITAVRQRMLRNLARRGRRGPMAAITAARNVNMRQWA